MILCLLASRHFLANKSIILKHKKFIIIQGLLGVTGFNSLVYLAMQTTTAINAVLVNSCIPILIAVMSWLMFRDSLTIRQVLGIFISLCGVLLIIAKGKLAALLGVDFNKGDIYVFFAAILWATYSSNLKRFPPELNPLAYLMAIVIVGLIGITPFFLWELNTGQIMAVTQETIITIVYVAVFASVLAFIFWNRAVRTIGANKAGPFIHLMPVFSTILAIIFLDEKLTSYHIQGILLIFLGISLTTFRVRNLKK